MTLICLLLLTVFSFAILVYSFLQTNEVLFNLASSRFLSVKFLDTSSAATLFVTLVGALVIRHQFVLGVLPRINYNSSINTRGNDQDRKEPSETWRVEIRNTGLGSAIINRAEYFIEAPQVRDIYCSYNFGELIIELTKVGLVRDHDYWIDNTTSGYSLSPKDSCFVFEIKTQAISKLKSLTMVLYFQGQLGDKYSKGVSLLPNT